VLPPPFDRALALLLLAALVACAGPTPSEPDAGARPESSPDVERVEHVLADGVLHVTVSIPREPPGPKPAVIEPIGDDEALLSRGIVVVHFRHVWARAPGVAAPEPESASEPAEKPVGRWLLAAPRPGIVGRNYFALIGAIAEGSVPRVVDLLETLPSVDPERIGMSGSSTGGFVALEAMIAEPRLAAGVVRVACGDYHAFLRSSTLALADDARWLPEGRLPLDADYDAELTAREPIRNAEALPPRPLLMLNGTADDAIPYECALRTAEILHAAYARAGALDRFRFIAFEDVGHDLGDQALRAAERWWERWLLH
jgi:predicted esterase